MYCIFFNTFLLMYIITFNAIQCTGFGSAAVRLVLESAFNPWNWSWVQQQSRDFLHQLILWLIVNFNCVFGIQPAEFRIFESQLSFKYKLMNNCWPADRMVIYLGEQWSMRLYKVWIDFALPNSLCSTQLR